MNAILLTIILIPVFLISELLTFETLPNLLKRSKLSLIILSINNLRIGSTYALILEAFKLGS